MQNDNAQLISTSGTIVFYRPPPEPNGEFPPEKYFADDSYWYMKIKPNPKLHPNNDEMIAWMLKQHADDQSGGKYPNINWNAWTHPIYNAYEDTPVYHVYCRGYDNYVDIPFPHPYPIQIPGEADAAATIIDWYRGMQWSLGVVIPESGTYSVLSYNDLPLGGQGYRSPGGPWRGGGSGCPKLAYMIKPEEIEEGVIHHALGFTMEVGGPSPDGSRHDSQEGFVYPPAAHTDREVGSTNPYEIPEGARIQLDPAIDLDALFGVNPTGTARTAKIIAKCLQDYGMVGVEAGGTWHIYAEHDYTADWNPPSMGGLILQPTADLWTSTYSPWRVIDFDLYPEIDDMSEYVLP
jgi:hypothetical protein